MNSTVQNPRRFQPWQVALALLALLALAVPALVQAQIEGGERGVAPVNSSGDFVATDIKIEVEGESADDARSKGWRLAQRLGWSKLWAKTHGGAGASLPDGSLDGIVSAIEIVEEQSGPNHYKATVNVYFDRARAGQILGIRGAIVRSAPMLVIPVEISGGAEVVFEQRTEWQKAWARFRTVDSTIDYVRPSGAGAESLIVNAGQLGRRNREWWRVILDQFGAADVIMPVVRLERLYPGGPVVGHFSARSGPDNRLLRTFTLRAANEAGVPDMMDQAVKRMDGIYGEALSMGLLRPDQSLIVEQPIDASELTEVPPVVEAPKRDVAPARSADGVDFADVPDGSPNGSGNSGTTPAPVLPAPTPSPNGPENLLPPGVQPGGPPRPQTPTSQPQ